jgi:hypothetical protein
MHSEPMYVREWAIYLYVCLYVTWPVSSTVSTDTKCKLPTVNSVGEYCRLGCDTMKPAGNLLTFKGNLLPSLLGGIINLYLTMGITFHITVLFTVTDQRIYNLKELVVIYKR